jgi:hypothetical protein
MTDSHQSKMVLVEALSLLLKTKGATMNESRKEKAKQLLYKFNSELMS